MKNTFVAKVMHCDGEGGRHWVPVPTELSEPLRFLALHFGFIAITATIGHTSWDTSLMPVGDGTYFMTLPAKVRTKEKLAHGSEVEISFDPRMK